MKHSILTFSIAALVMSFAGSVAFAQNAKDDAALIEKAKKIHRNVITLDTHDDINMRISHRNAITRRT